MLPDNHQREHPFAATLLHELAQFHMAGMNRVCATFEAQHELVKQTNLFYNDDSKPVSDDGLRIRVPFNAELLKQYASGFDCLDVIARQCNGVVRRDGRRGGAMPVLMWYSSSPTTPEEEHLRCYTATLWDRVVTNQGWQDLGHTLMQMQRGGAAPPVPWLISFSDDGPDGPAHKGAKNRWYVMGGVRRMRPGLRHSLASYLSMSEGTALAEADEFPMEALACAVLRRYTQEWPLHSIHSPTLHVVVEPFTNALLVYARVAATVLFDKCLRRDHKWLLSHGCGPRHTHSMAMARDASVRQACKQACKAHGVDPNRPTVRGVVTEPKPQCYAHIVSDLLRRELTQRIAGLAAEVGVLFGGVANEMSPYAVTDCPAPGELDEHDQTLFSVAAARQMDPAAYNAALSLVEMAAQVCPQPVDQGPLDSDAATFLRGADNANAYTRVPQRDVQYQTCLELNTPEMHPFSNSEVSYLTDEAIEAMRRVLIPDSVHATYDEVSYDADTKSMWAGRHAARTSRCYNDATGVAPTGYRASADAARDAAFDVPRRVARYRHLNVHLRSFLAEDHGGSDPLFEPAPYLPAEPCKMETRVKRLPSGLSISAVAAAYSYSSPLRRALDGSSGARVRACPPRALHGGCPEYRFENVQQKIELLAQTAAHLAFVVLAQPNVGELQWLPDPGSRRPPRTQRWSHPPLDDPLPAQTPHTQLHKTAWYAHLMEEGVLGERHLPPPPSVPPLVAEDHARAVHRLHVDVSRLMRLHVIKAGEPVRKALRELHTMHHLRPALAAEMERRAQRARTDQLRRTQMQLVLNELRLIWCGVSSFERLPGGPTSARRLRCLRLAYRHE